MELVEQTHPQISVVIPAFNEEKYLPLCLSSLQKQTFKDFETIVIDNNSTDQTAKVAHKFGARVVQEKKQGMIPARERGFKEAKAEIIARTDADAVLTPQWLEKIDASFTNKPNLVAVTGSYELPEVNKIVNFLIKLYIDLGYYKLTRLLTGHFPLSGPNNAIRKSAWQKITVHQDDRLVHEDMDLACHLFPIGKIEYHPEIKATYNLRRWKKHFWYTLFEYGIRYFRTIFIHHHYFRRHQQ